jgi:hypothetical protein
MTPSRPAPSARQPRRPGGASTRISPTVRTPHAGDPAQRVGTQAAPTGRTPHGDEGASRSRAGGDVSSLRRRVASRCGLLALRGVENSVATGGTAHDAARLRSASGSARGAFPLSGWCAQHAERGDEHRSPERRFGGFRGVCRRRFVGRGEILESYAHRLTLTLQGLVDGRERTLAKAPKRRKMPGDTCDRLTLWKNIHDLGGGPAIRAARPRYGTGHGRTPAPSRVIGRSFASPRVTAGPDGVNPHRPTRGAGA